jgi:hypothetical protein
MPQSPILKYEHIQQGQGQKETTANVALDTLERKLTTEVSLDAAGTGDLDLTDDQARDMSYQFTGVLTGNRTITIPPRAMLYVVENATSGAFTVNLEVIGGGGASVLLGRGFRHWIYCDGVDCIELPRVLLDYVADVATTYQATAYDRVINGDTVGGAFTITLPQAAPGRQVLINSIGAATTLTIARGGSDTIKGVSTSITISTQWQGVLFVGESATNWVAYRLTVA